MKKGLFLELITGIFLLFFVYTATSKVIDYNGFKTALGRSPLIGDRAAVAALALLIAEVLVVVLIFIPHTRLWGLYGSFALMTVYTIYLAYMISSTPKLPWPCDGLLKQLTLTQHLIVNIFLLAVAVAGVVLKRKEKYKTKERELPPVVFT